MPGQKLSYPGRNYLFAPGPTHIPTVVQNAMNVPMEDHRAPDFPELVKPILSYGVYEDISLSWFHQPPTDSSPCKIYRFS